MSMEYFYQFMWFNTKNKINQKPRTTSVDNVRLSSAYILTRNDVLTELEFKKCCRGKKEDILTRKLLRIEI